MRAKTALSFLALVLALVAFVPAARAGDLDTVLKALGLNRYMRMEDGRQLEARLTGPGNNLVVYGKPEDVKGASPPQTWRNGQPRYFGYTWDGNHYANKDFPNEVVSAPRAKRQWIKEPWKKGLCTLNGNDNSNVSPQTWDIIVSALQKLDDPLPDYVLKNPKQYMLVLGQPKVAVYMGDLYGAVGTVRMWHQHPTQGICYETFNIDPIIGLVLIPGTNNLKLTGLTTAPATPQPGTGVTVKFNIENESTVAVPQTKLVYKVYKPDGSLLVNQTVPVTGIPARAKGNNGVKQFSFTFTPPAAGKYTVAAMVNPDHNQPENEANYLNGDWPGDNRIEGAISVVAPAAPPVSGPCGPHTTYTHSLTYQWKEWHETKDGGYWAGPYTGTLRRTDEAWLLLPGDTISKLGWAPDIRALFATDATSKRVAAPLLAGAKHRGKNSGAIRAGYGLGHPPIPVTLRTVSYVPSGGKTRHDALVAALTGRFIAAGGTWKVPPNVTLVRTKTERRPVSRVTDPEIAKLDRDPDIRITQGVDVVTEETTITMSLPADPRVKPGSPAWKVLGGNTMWFTDIREEGETGLAKLLKVAFDFHAEADGICVCRGKEGPFSFVVWKNMYDDITLTRP